MKFKNQLVATLALMAAFLAADGAQASNRLAHRFGLSFGLLGDPFPTLLGMNASYNLTSFMRATAGYGSISGTSNSGAELKLSTMGGGLRLFMPDWNFSPVVGISAAKVSLTGSGTLSGFDASGSHIYGTAGFDWQSAGGFNFGFGANMSTLKGVGAVPYINLGWYF